VRRQEPGVSSNIQKNVPDTQKQTLFEGGEQTNITLQNMNGAACCINAALATLN